MGFRRSVLLLSIPLSCLLFPGQSSPETQQAFPPEDSTRQTTPSPHSGEVALEAVVDSSRVPSNRNLTLIIRATCAGDASLYEFQWPRPPDMERFDIVGSSSANVAKDQGGQRVNIKEFRYILRPVGEGRGLIGPVSLSYTDKLTQMEYTLSTRAINVEITEPLAEGPGGVPTTLFILIGFVAIILAVAGVLYRRTIRGRREEESLPIETKSPEERALEELEKVPELRLTGETKEYYSAISNTIRRYIDRRFSLRTIELTTRDIVNHLRLKEVEEETIMEIEKILTACDMVKFARHEPAPSDVDQTLSLAHTFFTSRIQTPVRDMNEGTKEDTES